MNQTLSKILALTMAVLIVFTLAACQGGTTTTTGSTTGATTTKATTTAATTAPATTSATGVFFEGELDLGRLAERPRIAVLALVGDLAVTPAAAAVVLFDFAGGGCRVVELEQGPFGRPARQLAGLFLILPDEGVPPIGVSAIALGDLAAHIAALGRVLARRRVDILDLFGIIQGAGNVGRRLPGVATPRDSGCLRLRFAPHPRGSALCWT